MHIVAGISPGYICIKNGKDMMTREEIIEIEQYCSDHKVGKKSRLAELGIPFWNFYRARRKYQREDELIGSAPSAGNFIQLATLPSGPALQPSKRMIRQKFAFRSCPAAFKADDQAEVPEGCRTDS